MTDNSNDKSKTPLIIVIICASISMLVQTIASAISVMGYDDVIRADAKARAEQILQGGKVSPELQARLDLLESQANKNTLIIESLLENSHAPGG